MTPRQTASKHSTFTAAAALCLLGAWYAAPAFAASDHEIFCDDSHRATLEVAEHELVPRQVSHENTTADLASSKDDVLAKDHLLKPGAEATVRDVFAAPKGDGLTEEEVIDEADDVSMPELSTSPMTDGHAVPFKRQMFRRDI